MKPKLGKTDLGIPSQVSDARIHQLWDALYAIPSSASDHALVHLLETVSDWIAADQAYWAAAVRFPQAAKQSDDGLRGWRVRATRSLHPYTKAQIALFKDIRRQYDNETLYIDDATRALVVNAGTHRTRLLHDGLVDFNAFRQTKHYRTHFEAFGVVDRLWSVFPISRDAEAYFFFDLIHTNRRFTQNDVKAIATAMRPLGWLHQQLFLSHGILIANKPLTRTQRLIVQLLLTGRSEREIAEEAGQNLTTTHKHIETIYRAFSVNSRASLMALWLSGGQP